MDYIIYFSLTVMTLALILAAVRFYKGPSAGDRTLALDTMTTIGVSSIVLLAYLFDRYIYLDVALVYGVLGFIGVIVIARYLEKAL